VERDLDQLLNFFSVPASHWKKVRTTNVIERAFREVRRRTRPMSSFSNTESCDCITYGVISHLKSSWERTPFYEFTHLTVSRIVSAWREHSVAWYSYFVFANETSDIRLDLSDGGVNPPVLARP